MNDADIAIAIKDWCFKINEDLATMCRLTTQLKGGRGEVLMGAKHAGDGLAEVMRAADEILKIEP